MEGNSKSISRPLLVYMLLNNAFSRSDRTPVPCSVRTRVNGPLVCGNGNILFYAISSHVIIIMRYKFCHPSLLRGFTTPRAIESTDYLCIRLPGSIAINHQPGLTPPPDWMSHPHLPCCPLPVSEPAHATTYPETPLVCIYTRS